MEMYICPAVSYFMASKMYYLEFNIFEFVNTFLLLEVNKTTMWFTLNEALDSVKNI